MADIVMRVCSRCKEARPLAAFAKKGGRPDGVSSYCRPCVAQRNKEWREQPGSRERTSVRHRAWAEAIKVKTLAHYGGVCVCCGEDDIRFLTFDHIDGGGKQHRRAEMGSMPLSRWLRNNGYPDGFQILCWSCNSGRHFNGGVCPHQDPGGRITCASYIPPTSA
jgi:hypothetical protein